MSGIKNGEYSMFPVTEDLHDHDALTCSRMLEGVKFA